MNGKAELVKLVAQKSGMSLVEAREAVSHTIESMKELIGQEGIVLEGFGSFKIKVRAARKGRNPKTGEVVDIPEKRVVTFKPSGALRVAVNGSAGQSAATASPAEPVPAPATTAGPEPTAAQSKSTQVPRPRKKITK